MSLSPLSYIVKRIESKATAGFEQDVKRLISWASINSGTGNHEGNRAMLSVIADAFSDLPGTGQIMAIDSVDEQSSAYPAYYQHKCRPDAPVKILLNGHVDTVFGKDHSFQVCERIDADHLRGPGVTDMKGGLVVMLSALKIFEALGDQSNMGWEVLITCDEEIGSRNSFHALSQAANRNHLGITFESSLPDGKLVRKRMGVGTFTAKVRGKTAHVGRNFNEGKNAIVKLCGWIQRIDALNGKIPGIIVNAGAISGGGPLNVVSEYAESFFNVRVTDSTVERKLKEEFARIAESVQEEGYVCEWSGGLNRAAKESGPAFEVLFECWQQAASPCGLILDWRDTGGGSDGNILQSEGLPLIDNLGVVGDGIHSSDEYVMLNSLTERTRLVATFLWMLSAGMFDKSEVSFGTYLKNLQLKTTSGKMKLTRI